MATTRIIPMHRSKGKSIAQCLHDRTSYAKNPEKTAGGELVAAFACDPKTVDAEFLLSKREYEQITGRSHARDVIAYQVRQSFRPGEISPEEANRVGYEFASRFLKGTHAFIVATHVDKAHIHNHIIWNSTTLDCTHKFRNFWGSTKAIQRLSDMICVEHGLSIVEEPKGKGVHYGKWLGDDRKPAYRDQLREVIDAVLAKKPASLDALLTAVAAAGYEIKPGKQPAFRGAGQKRFIRLDSLGDEYALPALGEIIRGAKPIPQRKQWTSEKALAPKKVSLLVDIQTRMQAGKGPGFERWAKRFNLKQMAQTLVYLEEHKLDDYAVLTERTVTASERFRRLSERTKAESKRIAEIIALRTHIINYSKTADVYAAYRKAGYSAKFRDAHAADIQLHKEAKAAFDALGVNRLPKVKDLNAELDELQAARKADYAEYRQARAEMRELLTAKANIDRFLDADHHDLERKHRTSRDETYL